MLTVIGTELCEKLNSPLKLRETEVEYLGNRHYQTIKCLFCYGECS